MTSDNTTEELTRRQLMGVAGAGVVGSAIGISTAAASTGAIDELEARFDGGENLRVVFQNNLPKTIHRVTVDVTWFGASAERECTTCSKIGESRERSYFVRPGEVRPIYFSRPERATDFETSFSTDRVF